MLGKRELSKKIAEMKRNPTPYEECFLARMMRLRKEHGIGFMFQEKIGFYVADFCVPSRMLIIEIDGPIHDYQQQADSRRDAYLQALGFTVIRIKNAEAASFDLQVILDAQLKPNKFDAAKRVGSSHWKQASRAQSNMDAKIKMYSKYQKYNPNPEYMPRFSSKRVRELVSKGVIKNDWLAQFGKD